MPDNGEAHGSELARISKLLFDKGATLFYIAIIIECIAGIGGAILGIFELSDRSKLISAVLGFLLLLIAYICKVLFENTYDVGETMRRQSVFSSGLGWEIPKIQFSTWYSLAGEKIQRKAEDEPLDANYFSTDKKLGPERLLQMTAESSFWTRHLYIEIKKWLVPSLVLSGGLFILTLTFSASGYVQPSVALKVVYAIYLILPLLLALDILGWILRVGRIIKNLEIIESDLERIEKSGNISTENVIRLVAEYNCQVVAGFPIPGWFFRIKHDYIEACWKKHLSR